MSALTFKIAETPAELEQIFRLNYRTFVEEIPQREPNATGRLVDAFHAENTYLICMEGESLAGMLAVRGVRPFSLDRKLDSLDAYLPACPRPCEIRLLAIEAHYRKTTVFAGLFEHVVAFCRREGYDIALISGVTRQQKLYRHLGFVPFGPLVGTPEAPFQPMYLTESTLHASQSMAAASK